MEYVQREKQYSEEFANTTVGKKQGVQLTLDTIKAREELLCSLCKCCLSNYHLACTGDLLCYPCWSAFPNADKKKSVKGIFRFLTVPQLEVLVIKQTNFCKSIVINTVL
jgi:hypothetical protein